MERTTLIKISEEKFHGRFYKLFYLEKCPVIWLYRIVARGWYENETGPDWIQFLVHVANENA